MFFRGLGGGSGLGLAADEEHHRREQLTLSAGDQVDSGRLERLADIVSALGRNA